MVPSPKRLAGKVALITGAAKGIGAVIARFYAAEGARVMVNYLESRAAASVLCEEIIAAGGEAHSISGDISDSDGAVTIVDATVERYGSLDILVNNAAAYRYHTNLELTRESFRAQFEVNVLGSLLMVQAATPHFPKSGGRVINLSSISARAATPRMAIYTGLGRIGTGEDIARAAVFLASAEASFITGQVLTVDGGCFV